MTEQVVVLALVIGAIYGLALITVSNLDARGIRTGFAFLGQPANLGISETWISFMPGRDSYARALLAGAANTILVSVIAICLSTALGVTVGISRLSSNWLLSRSAGLYVEVIRNIPLPLQLLVLYQILLNLPSARQAINLGGVIVLSNRGLRTPAVLWGQWDFAWAMVCLVIVTLVLSYKPLMSRLGRRSTAPVGTIVVGASVFALLALTALAPPTLERPTLDGFNFRGGMTLSPELTALVFGLTLYAAAFIAEIVRAGVQSVSAGQWEAAQALGLSRGQTLRLIVLPQSLRLIIPPLASQYLSTIKDSSLAVVIGYPELASIVNTMIGETGQPVEGVALLMLAYLIISVPVGMFMNWYNRKAALVTR
jgi:general L-amino acid transport system permease protein